MTSLGSPIPLVALVKGTSRLVKIVIRDENGNNFDMTDGRAVFWVGKSVDATGDDIIIEKSSGSGITMEADTDGLWTASIVIVPEDSENEPSRASYYCECRVWDQSNNEYVIAAGAFEIDSSLTLSAQEPP